MFSTPCRSVTSLRLSFFKSLQLYEKMTSKNSMFYLQRLPAGAALPKKDKFIFTILTVHGVHNQDCIILMNNRHQPNLHDIGNVEPPSQNHRFQNSRANIAGPLHQGHCNLRLSSLFCKYRLRQHKNHGQNKLGLDSQLKNTERKLLNFQNFNKMFKYFQIQIGKYP